ncbi:MAG: SEC-C metal-binding domain-containing protein [Planctomycetaceae bacterium]|nr:SEC-C metal-binding domain-containing protein [Planctomycetaceae bacterium]
MHPTIERLTAALRDERSKTRQFALTALCDLHANDAEVTASIAAALEQFGIEQAFQHVSLAEQLTWTPSTVARVFDVLDAAPPSTTPADLLTPAELTCRMLWRLSPHLLAEVFPRFERMDVRELAFESDWKPRAALLSLSPEGLCDRLEQMSLAAANHQFDEFFPELMMFDLCELLAQHPAVARPWVCDRLRDAQRDLNPNGWLWLSAGLVRLAGRIGGDDVTRALIEFFRGDFMDDYSADELDAALTRIGGEVVTANLLQAPELDDFSKALCRQNVMSSLLTEEALECCLTWLRGESDEMLQSSLAQKLTFRLSPTANTAIYELAAANGGFPEDGEWADAIDFLEESARLTGQEFPRIAQWKVDFQTNFDRRRAALGSWTADWERDDDDSAVWVHEPLTPQVHPDTIRSQAKVGRNDPCPCGSGKKFKKCCLQHQQG